MQNIKGFLEGGNVYKKKIAYSIANQSDLRLAAPSRKAFSSKYDNGRVIVIGGSSSYHGAPSISLMAAYNTLAALRVGAGYVRTYVPQSILESVRSVSPNMVVIGAGKNRIKFTSQLKKDIERTDAVAIGMGIGNDSSVEVKNIISYCLLKGVKTVVDADAISCLKLSYSEKNKNLLITPHDAEFKKLFDVTVPKDDINVRRQLTSYAAGKYKMNVLLKGHYTIVSNAVSTKMNKSKTAALATMGSGDVLSGIIAGYAACGADMFKAAVAGSFLHSTIGDHLHAKMGNHIIATDIIDKIPYIIKEFDRK